MSLKVVSYIRVSTEEQAVHGHSIDAQKQLLEDYAKGHDLDVVASFVESESAFKLGRSGFKQMVDLLKKQKSIRSVLIYKYDRISRNMSDYALLVEQMGVEIISATEELPRNATGQMMGGIQMVWARYFSAQLSERVTDAMMAKARKGLYPSGAPFGYLNDSETKNLIPDPKRALLVKDMFEVYANTDIALSGLVNWAEKKGLTSRKGNPLRKSTIYRILTNPVYMGLVRWKGVIYPGQHELLVSRYLYERVQEKLEGRGQGKSKREFPFRGILVCGYCGCKITASLIKGKYVYYHCTRGRGKCEQPFIPQADLAEQLQSIVDGVRIPQEVVINILEQIREGEQERGKSIQKRIAVLNTEDAGLRHRRDKAYIDKLDGVLAEDRWKELEGKWSERAQAITAQQEELKKSLLRSGADDAQEAFKLLESASHLYSEQSPQEQARALKILVSNCTLKGENVEPDYKKPFDLVAEGVRTANWYPREDSEPGNSTSCS